MRDNNYIYKGKYNKVYSTWLAAALAVDGFKQIDIIHEEKYDFKRDRAYYTYFYIFEDSEELRKAIKRNIREVQRIIEYRKTHKGGFVA